MPYRPIIIQLVLQKPLGSYGSNIFSSFSVQVLGNTLINIIYVAAVLQESFFFTSLLARVELLTTSLNNLLYTNLKLSVCFVFYFPPF